MSRFRGAPGWIAVLLLATLAAGCSQQTAPARPEPGTTVATAGRPTASATGAPTSGRAPTSSPQPATDCSDDQPGRYTTELFEPAPTSTLTYTSGLQVDVFAPADDPATCKIGVVWVHGGGFTQFARDGEAEREWGAALARRGFVLASIDYRLGTGSPFGLDEATDPERNAVVANAIADAQTAVRWLRGEAGRWGVAPSRVAIGGTSAGAMTALGAALTTTDPPCAVVAVSGDLRPEWVTGPPAPVLFIHGNADDVVPYSSSVAGAEILRSAGGSADVVTIDGAGHEITGPPRPGMVDAAARWLSARCR